MKNNIALIGMPGAGKSTVGVLLAKLRGMDFVDSDMLIQLREHATLQEIIEREDYLYLRRVESEVLQSINGSNLVIATGGSAVYSEQGIAALRKHAVIVYLQATFATIQQRVHNISTRGIAMRGNQDLQSLFQERCPLYERAADLTITMEGMSSDHVAECIGRCVEQQQNINQ